MMYVAQKQMGQGLPLENRRIMTCQPKLVTALQYSFVSASRRHGVHSMEIAQNEFDMTLM